MNIMRSIIVLMVVQWLIGCAAQQEEARREHSARINAQCQSYGFRPGTADYSSCLMRLDLEAQRRAEAQDRDALGTGVYLLGPGRCSARDASGRALCP